jgi:hypothetical protein
MFIVSTHSYHYPCHYSDKLRVKIYHLQCVSKPPEEHLQYIHYCTYIPCSIPQCTSPSQCVPAYLEKYLQYPLVCIDTLLYISVHTCTLLYTPVYLTFTVCPRVSLGTFAIIPISVHRWWWHHVGVKVMIVDSGRVNASTTIQTRMRDTWRLVWRIIQWNN